jgi:hypothetical protein
MSAVVDKIRKLLAVTTARGATENEAAQAMAAATRLMMQHGIDKAEVTKGDVGFGDVLEMDKKYHMFAAFSAMTLMGTKVVTNGKEHIQFVGREDNVMASMVLYKAIIDQIERLYKEMLPKGMSKADRANYRRTFKEAAVARVFARCTEIVNTLTEGRGTALLVLDHRKQLASEADDFIKGALPKSKGKTVSINRHDTAGGIAGYHAGNRVKLQDEVDEETPA